MGLSESSLEFIEAVSPSSDVEFAIRYISVRKKMSIAQGEVSVKFPKREEILRSVVLEEV
jgi:hypothetical protein